MTLDYGVTHHWEKHHRRALNGSQTLDWSLDATALLARHLQGSLRILELVALLSNPFEFSDTVEKCSY